MNSHSLDLVSSFVFAFELSVSCGFFPILLLPALSLVLLKKTTTSKRKLLPLNSIWNSSLNRNFYKENNQRFNIHIAEKIQIAAKWKFKRYHLEMQKKRTNQKRQTFEFTKYTVTKETWKVQQKMHIERHTSN